MLTTSKDEVKLIVFLSDEIFAKNIPILVTVDPISSAILRIELADSRKVEDWKNHWECLEQNGYLATYLVTDEGRGLCSAQKEALDHQATGYLSGVPKIPLSKSVNYFWLFMKDADYSYSLTFSSRIFAAF
jgi:hypothetical protein